jgi:hypothetical protein
MVRRTWQKTPNNTVSFAIDKKKGEVIYMIDNPCLGVLGNGNLLFSNALF